MRFLILIFLVITVTISQSQVVRHITDKDGLPSNVIYDVIQDHKGFIWIATEAGVCRYDGQNFKYYTTKDGLGDNEIFFLYEDAQQRIWCTPYNGKLSYIKNGKGYNPENSPLLSAIRPGFLYHKPLEKKDGTLYFSTNGRKVLVVSDTMKYIDYVDKSRLYVDYLSGDTMYTYNLNARQYIVNDTVVQLYNWPIKSKGVAKYGNAFILNRFDTVYHIEDQDLTLLHAAGKWRNDHLIQQSIDIPLPRSNTYSPGFLNISLRPNGGSSIFTKHKDKMIANVVVDVNEGTWLATQNNGIYYYPKTEVKIISSPNEQTILGANYGFDIMQGGAWMSFLDKVYQLNNQGEIIKEYRIDGCKEIKLVKLSYDKMQLYVSCEKKFYVFNTDTKSIDKWEQINTAVKDIIVEEEKIYIARFRDLFEYDLMRNKIKELKYSRTTSASIVKGILYYGNNDGLFSIKDTINPIIDDRINALGSGYGWVLACTHNAGLFVYKAGYDSIWITTEEGLSSEIVFSADWQDEQTLWVGTNNGLNRIKFNNGITDSYSIDHFSDEYYMPSKFARSVMAGNESVWVSTENGVCIIPYDVKSPVPPATVLEQANATGNHRIDPNETLSYTQNDLSFSFAGIYHRLETDMVYLYRLKGLNDAWQSTSRTSVNYESLPSGNYRFEVKSSIGGGIESDQPASIAFSIGKPWWRTNFAIAVALLFLLLLLTLIVIAIIRARERASRQNLEVMELRQSALTAQMNPHFLFNSLNSIQNFITMNDEIMANEYLTKFSKLTRHTLDSTKKTNIVLSTEIEALETYLQLEKLRFGDEFNYEISCEDQIKNAILPTMMIQPFVENAILHGFKGLERKGMIRIKLKRVGDELQCIIEDNGIGRKAAQKKSKKERISYGLSIARERLAQMQQISGKKYEVEILDIEGNESVKTKVVITIPYQT